MLHENIKNSKNPACCNPTVDGLLLNDTKKIISEKVDYPDWSQIFKNSGTDFQIWKKSGIFFFKKKIKKLKIKKKK